MHNFTVVRSVNHRISAHNSAAYYSLTGHEPLVDIVSATASASDFPAYGSVVSKLAPSKKRVPTFVSLPWMIADGVFRTPGEFAGYLGKEHDPLFITKDPNSPNFSVEELTLPIEVPLERVSSRQALRSGLAAYPAQRVDRGRPRPGRLPAEGALAPDLVRDAAGLRHPRRRPRLRDRYGRTPYGQSVLMARRLVEAGVRFVTVFYSPGIVGWDTHSDNFSPLRREAPARHRTDPADPDRGPRRARPAGRHAGRLDGRVRPHAEDQQGRRPRPLAAVLHHPHGRRRHKRGFVYGASDPTAAYPKDNPCTPDDISATMFHAWGSTRPPSCETTSTSRSPCPRHAHHAAAGLRRGPPRDRRGGLIPWRAPSGPAGRARRILLAPEFEGQTALAWASAGVASSAALSVRVNSETSAATSDGLGLDPGGQALEPDHDHLGEGRDAGDLPSDLGGDSRRKGNLLAGQLQGRGADHFDGDHGGGDGRRGGGGRAPLRFAAPSPWRRLPRRPGSAPRPGRPSVGPSGASAAAVTLTSALVPLSLISDSATLRPVGGEGRRACTSSSPRSSGRLGAELDRASLRHHELRRLVIQEDRAGPGHRRREADERPRIAGDRPRVCRSRVP